MKTRSLLVSRLLLLVLVPILAEAFSVNSRVGNNVTLTGCQANIYYKGTRLTEMGQNYNLIVTDTTEGVYDCGIDGNNDAIGHVTVLRQFVQTDTVVPRTFVWGERHVLDCTGYVPGNSHSSYKVTWLLDDRQTCSKDTCQNFNIAPNNFSLSFDYYPTFTTYECQIDSDEDETLTTVTVASYNLSTSNNDNTQTQFIENLKPVLVENGMNKVEFSCSASVQSNASINFEASDMSNKSSISPDDCDVTTTVNPTIRTCNETLHGMNVTIMCNYSISYEIHCTFSWNLTNNNRRVYPVACHVNDGTTETSTRTGLIVRNGNLPPLNYTYGENNERLSSLSVLLPFKIPTPYVNDTIKLSVIFNNSETNVREFRFNDIAIQDGNRNMTVDLSNETLVPGELSVKYNLSFFGETPEESPEEIITIAAPTTTPEIVPTSSLDISTMTSSDMPSMSIPVTSMTPTVGPHSPSSPITLVAAGIAIVTVIIFVLIILLILLVIGNRCRKTNSKKINSKPSNGHQTGRGLEEGNNGRVELINASMYNQLTDSSMLGANSAVSLINSDSPPHVHNGCNCSCHTRSTHSHSSGPSQSSTTSYHSRMQLTQQINYDMPRYGYPYTAEMPTTTTSTIMPQGPPSSLNLNQQVPSVQVQEPTPVMINVPNLVSPTGTLPFESDSEPNQDTPRPNRPTHLDIPENQKGRRQGSGSSTPIGDSIMLAVMLYLQHQNCNNRKYCPCCKMITKQFEKIAREQGQETLEKAMKDIQTPGTEGHKQMLRRRGRTPRSPHRVGFHLGGELKRQRSSSTSKVHDEELTFSSTETEEDEKSMRKARSSRKVHTDDEMEFFLPLSSALNSINSKDLASSEPDLNTPIALPPSLAMASYSGITPTNPAPMKSKRDSSDESSGVDDTSSSSSSRPNSNPRLDNIHPTDDTSKSLLLSSAATIMGSSSNTAPYSNNKLSVENKHNSVASYSSGYVSQSESDKEGKALPPPPAATFLQPVQSDNELSDTDSYRESSPARLIPETKKTKREGRGPSPVPSSQAPPHRSQRPAPRLSDHRPPYPVATNGLHPYHASPSHKSSTISYHRQNRSMPGDSSSIHSSQSVRLIDSDHSSSGSTHSIHSDGAVYPPTASHGHNHHHRHHHHHHHQHGHRMGSRNNTLHNSANVISLPSDASTSTAL